MTRGGSDRTPVREGDHRARPPRADPVGIRLQHQIARADVRRRVAIGKHSRCGNSAAKLWIPGNQSLAINLAVASDQKHRRVRDLDKYRRKNSVEQSGDAIAVGSKMSDDWAFDRPLAPPDRLRAQAIIDHREIARNRNRYDWFRSSGNRPQLRLP